jgi:halocyanin-like protein
MCLDTLYRMQMNKKLSDVDVERRTVLRGVGAVALTGVLAGCGGGGSDGGDGSSGGDGGDDSGGVPSEVESYLSDANNYESVADETGSDSVTVDVGAADGLAFGPAAVRISTGTTITWEWTGNGGSHNVIAEDDTFDSGELQVSGSFEHTFESTGAYNYFCQPHKQSGMKGAVIVE